MRAVVTRVARAQVQTANECVAQIERGLLVLLGVGLDDGEDDAAAIAHRIAHLRIFPDGAGLMNRSVLEVRGSVLLVSQFTLHGDARRGRRPSFASAAREEQARPLYERAGALLEREGIPVRYGVFGAQMLVESVNDGPVTILLDTKKAF